MKTPKLLSKLSAVLTPRPQKKLKATARLARPAMDDYDAEEPTTKLSSAFIVVLILHVVAVGGIYAFNSIKASRRDREVTTKTAEPVPQTPPKAAAQTEAPPAAVASVTPSTRKTEPAAIVPAPVSANPGLRRYEIKGGDNLTKIAYAYKVSAAEILAANQLKEGAVLHPGQALMIPPSKTIEKPAADGARATAGTKQADVPPTKTTPGLYTVKKGDTLTSIARNFGLTSGELANANHSVDPKKLQLGQVLKVPPRKS